MYIKIKHYITINVILNIGGNILYFCWIRGDLVFNFWKYRLYLKYVPMAGKGDSIHTSDVTMITYLCKVYLLITKKKKVHNIADS